MRYMEGFTSLGYDSECEVLTVPSQQRRCLMSNTTYQKIGHYNSSITVVLATGLFGNIFER